MSYHIIFQSLRFLIGFNEKQKRMNLDKGDQEKLVRVEEGKTVIRIFYIRKTIFNKRKHI